MASRAFEENFEVTVPTVEAVPSSEGMPAYPHQSLRATGQTAEKSLRSVVLENPYLRVTVCPDLGGRIVRMLDKQSGTEILPDSDMELVDARYLGDWPALGIAFFGGRHYSPESISQVDYLMHQPDDETGSAAVMTFALMAGCGLSLQTCITLPPDSAKILVELRVHNRTLLPVKYSCGLHVDMLVGSGIFKDYERHVGFFVDGAECYSGGAACVADGVLAPREVIEHRLQIVPFTGLSECFYASNELIVGIEGSEMLFHSASAFPTSKVFALTTSGQTLEVEADLDPQRVFKVKVPKKLSSVKMLDSESNELISFQAYEPIPDVKLLSSPVAEKLHDSSLDSKQPGSLDSQVFKDVKNLHSSSPQAPRTESLPMHLRGVAHLVASKHFAASSKFRQADESLGDALSTLADDPLTWWMKAVVQRLLGEADSERPELLNAHYLSPLEPALRAESYLSLEQTQGSEPNPLLKPLVEDPDAMHEVVHLLIEAGLFAEAARLIDEAQRHREHPLLRYMLGWCLLHGTRMAAEAHEHVKKVSGEPIQAPYPWRPFEVRAVRELAAEFPHDERLQSLVKLINVNDQRPR